MTDHTELLKRLDKAAVSAIPSVFVVRDAAAAIRELESLLEAERQVTQEATAALDEAKIPAEIHVEGGFCFTGLRPRITWLADAYNAERQARKEAVNDRAQFQSAVDEMRGRAESAEARLATVEAETIERIKAQNAPEIEALNAHLKALEDRTTSDATLLRIAQEEARLNADRADRTAQIAATVEALLQRWIDYNTKAAGMTKEIVRDKDKFSAFLNNIESNSAKLLNDSIRALKSAAENNHD